jgi:2-oxoisovalerate dehydrogenase E1 component alpha subunit
VQSVPASGDPARRPDEGESVIEAATSGPSPEQDGLPETVQLLTPQGERVTHPDYDVDLDPDTLRGFYRDMVMVRRVDGEATSLQRQGEMGLWVPVLGQEAAQIGSGRALAAHDYVFPSYREHGVAWCRGLDPMQLIPQWRGVEHGGWDPAQYNFHLYSIVIGSQVLHATGYAMGVLRDGAVGTGDPERDTAVLAYFGDGASSQGDVNESFVFAGVFHVPIVFFLQNNQWAISVPQEKQSRVPLYRRASGFGFPGIRVDGNDVLATYAVTRAALTRARNGDGPMLIEAYTYRMGAHTTSDDPGRYRPAAEVEAWRARDPINRLRIYLEREGIIDEGYIREIDAEADEAAVRVRRETLAMPPPTGTAIFEHVYAEEHAQVSRERAWFEQYEASFLVGEGEGAR